VVLFQVYKELQAYMSGTFPELEFFVDRWPHPEAVVCRVDPSKTQVPSSWHGSVMKRRGWDMDERSERCTKLEVLKIVGLSPSGDSKLTFSCGLLLLKSFTAVSV
jgi:hypothetical protein